MVDSKDSAAVSRAIEKIGFNYPTSNAERMSQIRAAIKMAQIKLKRERGQLLEGNRSLIVLMALFETLNKEEITIEQNLTAKSGVAKACLALPIGGTSDFALSLSGKISVSWYSLAFPDRGAFILAHELGHMVSGIIRGMQLESPETQMKFSDSLTCVANRNPFLTEKVIKLIGSADTKLSEEDWADHFSALVMDELAANKSPLGDVKNLACALVKNENNYRTNTLSPAENDTHSSALLRLLMIATDRRQVTSQCQQIVDQFSTSNNLRCH